MPQRALVLLFATLAYATTAHAATFTVNSTTDAVDASPGNGTCATAASVCTLRAAIQESNALAGKDTIVLAAATYTLTRAGAGEDAAVTGDLDITDDLDLKGQGPTVTIINANQLDRAIDCDVQPVKHKVRISGLRVRNGFEFAGGGIQFACDLTLTEVSLRDNTGQAGGAVAAQMYWTTNPSLTMTRCEVRDNDSWSGAGLWLDDAEPIVIRETVFWQNEAQLIGGAIDADGDLTIQDSYFYKNTASVASAIWSNVISIDHSTFATHTSGASSGTVLVGFSGEITNSTFTDNWAPLGGAIAVGGSGNALINNVTFKDNEATDTSNFESSGASLSGPTSGGITIGNSLFENEYPKACASYATLVSLGYNRIDDDSCSFSSPGDVEDNAVDLDPSLADNGGPTMTFALVNDSQAIDWGSPDVPGTTASSSETTDQRYVTRPVKGFFETSTARSDQGAFEKCVAGSGPDSDGDGVVDMCDADDDDDTCLDAHDSLPFTSTQPAGTVYDFCDGKHTYYSFEGADPDNDGFANCEDPDDDDDGVLDGSDPCPQDVLPACVKPGKYLCWPTWVACLGGGCVENILKFYEVINPAREVRFDRFEIWNETVYMAPLANQTAAQSIAAIASNAPAQSSALRTTAAAAAAPLRLTGRVRIEMWSRATRTQPERRITTLGEYDAGRVRLGSLRSGGVIVLEPPADARSTLGASTTWADAALPSDLADFDSDLFPNAFDNCEFVSNADQRDSNRDGIGDACVMPPHAR